MSKNLAEACHAVTSHVTGEVIAPSTSVAEKWSLLHPLERCLLYPKLEIFPETLLSHYLGWGVHGTLVTKVTIIDVPNRRLPNIIVANTRLESSSSKGGRGYLCSHIVVNTKIAFWTILEFFLYIICSFYVRPKNSYNIVCICLYYS